LSAHRKLQYPSQPIYDIIADVPAYQSFLPYCISSSVARWSNPDAQFHRKWPEEAVLEIGWGSVRERFTSRIYCVPGKYVEAVGGNSKTRLDASDIAHHNPPDISSAAQDGVMTHLLTRWSVQEVDEKSTRVALDIEFQFANPMYAAMSSAVAGRVADVMIEAFEGRVRAVMEGREKEGNNVGHQADFKGVL
jgi:coenzyme Q-binding protein COQ10